MERGEEGGAGDQRGLLMQGNEVQAVVCFWVWSWWDRNVVLVGPECGPGGRCEAFTRHAHQWIDGGEPQHCADDGVTYLSGVCISFIVVSRSNTSV